MSQYPANGDSSGDNAPPARYICGICGAWGTHYVWNCTEQARHALQTTAETKMLPADDGMSKVQREQEKPLAPINPGNDLHSAETSNSCLLEPQKILPDEHIQNSASPKASWAPNHERTSSRPDGDDLMEWFLSLKTQCVNSPIREMRAQETSRSSL